MDEEKTLLEQVLENKLEALDDLTVGSKEETSEANTVKIIGDLHNQELKLVLDDADRAARREMDYEIKKKELAIRAKELDQRIVEHEDNMVQFEYQKKQDNFKNKMSIIGMAGTAIGLVSGYVFEYKFNGVEIGNTFKQLKNSLLRIGKRH